MEPTNTNNPPNSGRSSLVRFQPDTEEETVSKNLRKALREIKPQPSPADIEISLNQPLTSLAPHNSPKVIPVAQKKSEDRIKAEAEAERQAQAKKTRGASSQRVEPPRPPIYDPVEAGYKEQRKDIERKQEEKSFYAKTKNAFSSFQNGFMKFADTIAKSFGFETFTEKSLRKKSEKDKKTVNKGLPKTTPTTKEPVVIIESARPALVEFGDSKTKSQTQEQINQERFRKLTTSPQPRKNETSTAKGGEGKNKSDRQIKRAEMLRTIEAGREEGNTR